MYEVYVQRIKDTVNKLLLFLFIFPRMCIIFERAKDTCVNVYWYTYMTHLSELIPFLTYLYWSRYGSEHNEETLVLESQFFKVNMYKTYVFLNYLIFL